MNFLSCYFYCITFIHRQTVHAREEYLPQPQSYKENGKTCRSIACPNHVVLVVATRQRNYTLTVLK